MRIFEKTKKRLDKNVINVILVIYEAYDTLIMFSNKDQK